ncbi:MAG: hypothetical protein WD768_12755 [Phycisphaeraceae bacterium]
MSIVRACMVSLIVVLLTVSAFAEDLIEIQIDNGKQVQGRVRAIQAVAEDVAEEAPKKEDKGKAEEPKEPKEEEEPVRVPAEPIDPEIIRLHLQDGSIMTGKLSIKDIVVDTSFGKLTIPIANILSFRPGLDSFPNLAKKIDDQITALGSADFNEREGSQKALAAMGSQIRRLLENRLKDETDAERVRRLKQLLEGIEEAGLDEDEWGDEGGPKEWIKQDTIVTTDFTVVGTIVQKNFTIGSKFGELTVQLADVKRAERMQMSKEDLKKSIAVDGSNIAQRNFKNTRIKLEVGDRVSLTADGTITMTPWGSNAMSTPDGSPNYGWYLGNQMPAGLLVGKVGDSGQIFKVGSKHSFVAKKAGYLYLAIGMNPSYATQAFPGKYDVKVRVQPK